MSSCKQNWNSVKLVGTEMILEVMMQRKCPGTIRTTERPLSPMNSFEVIFEVMISRECLRAMRTTEVFLL